MIKQECIGIPDMILLLMIFCFKKIKIKAEIVLSPGGAYFTKEEAEVRKQEFFMKMCYAYFKNRFLSLRYSADFRLSGFLSW